VVPESKSSPSPNPNPYGTPAATGRPRPRAGSPDRRTAITFFGVLQILLGLLFVGMALLIPVALTVTARSLNQDVDYLAALPSILVYLLLGATLGTLGVGSMRARRWARNLTLVLGWAWLLGGILSLLGLAWILPGLLRQMREIQGVPASTQRAVIGIVLAIGSVFLFFIPGVLVLFYRASSVKATFEAHHREADWSEGCPFPVLTSSVWVLVSAVFFFFAPLRVHGTIPFFGTLLTGLPGALVYLLLAGLWGHAAWGLYHQRMSSFWSVFGSSLVLGVSSIVTFLRVDPISMYERMGYSADQLEVMRRLSVFNGPGLALFTAVFVVPFLGYLIYLRRYLNS
jgi:hypothetical protein